MINRKEEILYKSDHKEGRQHDYMVYTNDHPATPKDVKKYLDLGYIRIERDFS